MVVFLKYGKWIWKGEEVCKNVWGKSILKYMSIRIIFIYGKYRKKLVPKPSFFGGKERWKKEESLLRKPRIET